MRSGALTTLVLRLTCALMFVGHGWVCWNGDMPIRALLWDEELAKGAVKSLTGMDWGEWVSSMEVDSGINAAVRVQACLFFAFALAALVPFKRRALAVVHVIASINLTFLMGLKYHDAGVGIARFFEHLAQMVSPIVLLLWLWGKQRTAWWLAAIALASTFIGHGLFALDQESATLWLNHPRPGRFTEMTMLCLGFETELAANRFLVGAGVLDLIVAALIFAKAWPRLVALWWMVVWGFLTALARPWAYYEPTAAGESLGRWVPEALLRTPHFGLALFLLLALRTRRAELRAPLP